MCGLTGMIFGEKSRTKDEMDYYRKVFTYLLLLSQSRGPHATGIALLKRDGKYGILKQPRKASDFIRNRAFVNFLNRADSNTTWLAGHARWQTRGDASNNANNHPIRAGEVIGTHRGTITNADFLFAYFDLPRSAEVDSELIFRLADATLSQGQIDVAAFKARLARCKGEVSAVMASRLDPGKVVLIKGNNPLEVRYNRARQVVAYSSDAVYLDTVLVGDRRWKPIDLKPMTIATFSCDHLETPKCEPFELTLERNLKEGNSTLC